MQKKKEKIISELLAKILRTKAEKLNLKISKYVRLVLTEKELKVNEFKTDEVLLSYGNNFNRIKNLLRNREFSSLENKAEIMREIEGVTKLIYNYLYQNRVRDE